MISFRHHLTSLVAVFLALAVGIVLGGGPLSEVGREPADDAAETATRPDPTETGLQRFVDTYTSGTAGKVVGGELAAENVVLLRLPGAQPAVSGQLTDLVKSAGGTVVGDYDVRPALVDPGEKALVDTLGSQLVTQLTNVEVPSDATTYARIGQLLGAAVGSTIQAGVAPGDDAASIMASLEGADLLKTRQASTRGSLVLVVLGDEPDPDAGADVALDGLLTGLRQAVRGVTVTGSTASADGGLLEALRNRPDLGAVVSTVDSVQTGAGQATAVLALARTADGSTGAFGASGSDGAVPLG